MVVRRNLLILCSTGNGGGGDTEFVGIRNIMDKVAIANEYLFFRI